MDPKNSEVRSDIAALKPSRRRWWRYSLRTFLVVVTILCIWIAVIAGRARTQKRAIQYLNDIGLKQNILFSYELQANSTPYGVTTRYGNSHPLPGWLTKTIGEEYGREVWIVNFDDQQQVDPSDDDLAVIDNFRDLRQLTFYGKKRITDEGLKHFANLNQLNVLILNGTNIRGEGFKYLAELPNLRVLSLSKSAVTDDGLKQVSKIKSLHTLMISNTQVTDQGLSHLKSLPALERFEITGSDRITDEGIKHLIEIKSLKSVVMWENSKVTSTGNELLNNELKKRSGK